MTEIPFLVALLASYLAFACAADKSSNIWLWLAAACGVAAFGIRPFAAATIVSEAGTLIIYSRAGMTLRRSNTTVLVPFIAALLACTGLWLWLTVFNAKPWMLQYHQQQLRNYLTFVPLWNYADWGLLHPALYIGTALSPLAVLHAIHYGRRSILVIVIVLGLSILFATLNREHAWNLDHFGCFGGSADSLVLNGSPSQSSLSTWFAWMLVGCGSIGIAGLWSSLRYAIRQTNPTVTAVLVAAAIYWAAIPPLWLFADRYYLVLLPAASLLLAVAPLPRRHVAIGAAGVMTAVLALISLGGVVSYHRTMQKIVIETNALLRQGIPRKQIDAGYSLNGRDLYVYPARGMDAARDEPPIPLITSGIILPYVIAVSPMPRTLVWRRFAGCGPLGFGGRPLFILKSTPHPKPGKTR
jgi:hypothetical protein